MKWCATWRRATAFYMRTVRLAIHHPWAVLLIAFALLIAVPTVYGKVGKGVEFFPDVEPDTGVVLVHARGNLSLAEKDRLVRTVESIVPQPEGLSTVYARSGDMGRGGSTDVTEDTIGQIQFEFRQLAGSRAGQDDHGLSCASGPPTSPASRSKVTAAQGPARRPASRSNPACQQLSRRAHRCREADHWPSSAKYPEVQDLDSGLPMPGIGQGTA